MAKKVKKIATKLFSKVFIILFCVAILLFILTSFGVLKANTKITDFIQQIAQREVVKLEKELGLKIRWDRLQFTLLDFSIKMEDITLEKASSRVARKKPIPAFLDGTQYVKKIFLRPSLFFLFKKKIFFSKIELTEGDFFLKTGSPREIKKFSRKNGKDFHFPFKKIVVKNTNLNLRKKDRLIQFSGVRWNIKNTLGVYFFSGSIKKIESPEENISPLSFYMKGKFSDSDFSFDRCILENEIISLQTDQFTGSIENGRLKSLNLESRGELPFEVVRPWLSLFKEAVPDYKGQISYKLSLAKKGKRKLRGWFDIHSKEGMLQEIPLKEFKLKGHFIKNLFVFEKGLIHTEEGSLLKIHNLEMLLNSKALPFQLSVSMENMSADVITKLTGIKNFPFSIFPVKGTIKCKGQFAFLSWKCEGQFQVPQLTVRTDETDIISFHKVDVRFDLKRLNENRSINIHVTKKNSTDLRGEISYSLKTKKRQIKFQGYTFFQEDTQFASVNLKGAASFRDGLVEIQNGTVKVSGNIQSDFLEIAGYQTRNIQSSFKYENEKLHFLNLKSGTDRSHFNGLVLFDFQENALTLDLESSFFYVEDVLSILKHKISWPPSSGTGTTSFFMRYHFKDPLKHEIKVTGNLFNTRIQKEFSPSISFDISSKKGKGKVHFIKFKKNAGEVYISGTFDSRFHIDLDIIGSRIALERLQSLSSFIPFNQSGIAEIKMKAKGPISNPRLYGEVGLYETALYTYPVKASKLQVALDKKGLLLSGRIMEEIQLKRLYWPFDKNKPLDLQGSFLNWDFIKVWLARNQKESIQEGFSKITGDFDFSIEKVKGLKGSVEVNRMEIHKNSQWIKIRKPFRLLFKGTEWFLSAVHFEDDVGKYLSLKNIADDILISGDLSLELLSFAFPALRQIKGQAEVYLKSKKNLKDFNPRGSISVTEGNFALHGLPAIRNISLLMEVQNRKMSFKHFTGFSGTGTVTGKGLLAYDFTQPLSVDVRFLFKDITLNIPKDFSTTGEGELNIQGDKSPYSLTGKYTIRKGLITKEFSAQREREDLFSKYLFLKDKVKTEVSPFYLNIQLETLSPVFMKNSFIEASIKGGSQIHGPINDLIMDGEFEILSDTGHIVFRGQEFKINSGKVTFDNVPPDNPSLRATAQTLFSEKIIDTTAGLQTTRETTKEYSILLSASGPAKDLRVSLESFPPLSEKEIVSMLTLGVSSRYFDTEVKENTTQYSYQLLGSLLLRQPLGREIRERFGLELGIDPQIQKNKPVTKITLKRKWLKALEASFSRTIEELPQSDVKLKYNLNRNMALTAFWENKELKGLEDTVDDRNKTGLDLEMSFEF